MALLGPDTGIAVTALVVAALSLLIPMVFRSGEIWATLHAVRNRSNQLEARMNSLSETVHMMRIKEFEAELEDSARVEEIAHEQEVEEEEPYDP